MDDIETYEKTDAGASTTTPIQAGNVKKGTIALLKGFPCKVNIKKPSVAFSLLLILKKKSMCIIFKFRSSKFQPLKLENMVTLKQILLVLTSLPARNTKIFAQHLTIWRRSLLRDKKWIYLTSRTMAS